MGKNPFSIISINENEGDNISISEGIYLHFGDNCRIRVADTKEDLEDLIKHMDEVVVTIKGGVK